VRFKNEIRVKPLATRVSRWLTTYRETQITVAVNFHKFYQGS